MLERDRVPTAVIAFNDRAALGMMDLLVRRGVRIPEDISIVGNDDSEIAGRHYVDLTSVAQDTRRLAEEAVALAERRMAPASAQADPRSEERRVGKGGRAQGAGG